MSIIQTPSHPFARRLDPLESSTVLEMLKIAEIPDVISFAGGLPAPDLFPTRELAQAFYQVITEEGPAALQYSMTEGFFPLRDWIASRLQAQGMHVGSGDIVVTSGSQQGLDLVAKALLNAGDGVVVSRPTYLAALQTFSMFEAQLITVESDDDGMDVERVECKLRAHSNIKFIYIVTNFQNPSGTTLSLARRKRLVQLAHHYGVYLLEDDPFADLRYRGVPLLSLKALDESDRVIYLSSFSKTMAPGLRLGWLVAEPQIYRKLLVAKQASDLHTNTLSQRAAHRYLVDNSFDEHIDKIRAVYGERCQAMLAAMDHYFPRQTRWTRPEGGMFLWVELPLYIRAEELFVEAFKKKIAFVPGAAFFANERPHNFLRLNFSNSPLNKIDEGIGRLAQVIKCYL